MDKKVYLKKWKILGKKVKLTYKDRTRLYVKKTDFNRSFQCMLTCSKSIIKRDFAISKRCKV